MRDGELGWTVRTVRLRPSERRPKKARLSPGRRGFIYAVGSYVVRADIAMAASKK
jgi:hypothetical protein